MFSRVAQEDQAVNKEEIVPNEAQGQDNGDDNENPDNAAAAQQEQGDQKQGKAAELGLGKSEAQETNETQTEFSKENAHPKRKA